MISHDGVHRAYRGHFYGYERALRKQAPDEVTDKDEYITGNDAPLSPE